MESRSNVQTWLLEPSLPHSQYQSSTSPESRYLTQWGAVESFAQEMDLTSTHYLDVLACIRWHVAWQLFPLACTILDWSFDQEYKRKIPFAGKKKKLTKWIKLKTSSLMKWCLQVTRAQCHRLRAATYFSETNNQVPEDTQHAQDFEKMQHRNVFHPLSYHQYLPKLGPH